MRNTWVGVSSWGFCTGYPATRLSSHSVFQALIVFFIWRYLKWNVLVSLCQHGQNISNWFSYINIRNAVSISAVLQACQFFTSCGMDANLVADWWWTIWFDILFTFSKLLNLNPCCKIRATKCLQRTIDLYQYKLFITYSHFPPIQSF